MILNRAKLAKGLREAAERAARTGLLDKMAEDLLIKAGTGYQGGLLTLRLMDPQLARTERVLLCLLAAHAVRDEGHRT